MKPSTIWCAFLLTGALHAQEATNTFPEIEPETVEPGWSFSASVYTYLLPQDNDYAQPTITADHGWLHLEARYNYEDLKTGSVWIGYNCSLGSRLTLDFTPMLGGVFGNTAGVAPGYHLTMGWWWLEFYSEGEYLLDTSDRTESFYYSWSELTLSPKDWLRTGLVIQRTRAYESELEIQRGFLVGLNFKHFGVAGYVFNPDESEPTYVISIGVEF
jgi:hypothetical protein